MDKFNKDLLRQADDLDRELDAVLGTQQASARDVATWSDILANNGVEPRCVPQLTLQDQAISCIVGVAGGVLDLTQSFKSRMKNESVHQRFDQLSKDWLKRVTGEDGIAAIDNQRGGPSAHRLIGPAHDLSRFFEAIGQITKGEFRSSFGGVEKIVSSYGPNSADYVKVENPVDAAILLILHLIGDFFSAQSLPLPGRTQQAETRQVEIYRKIVSDFREGRNLREQVAGFLSNLSGTVLISITLRLYRYFVMFVMERQQVELRRFRLADDELYHLLHRDAQMIAFGISVGKTCFTQNLIDVNYTSFIQFVRSGVAIQRISARELERLDGEFQELVQKIEAI